MAIPTIGRPDTVRAELTDIIVPAAESLLEHDHYQGLLDGSLPAEGLAHLCQQDAHHLLPSYGRAHARCAGMARSHRHARLLAHMSLVSLNSANGSADGFPAMAARLGLPGGPDGAPAIAPATLHYASFLTASSAASLAAGLGAVLPSAWLYQLITDELMVRRDPEGRYGELLALMYPGEEFAALVAEFLELIEEFCAVGSAQDRSILTQHTVQAVRLEREFLDAAWRAGAEEPR